MSLRDEIKFIFNAYANIQMVYKQSFL